MTSHNEHSVSREEVYFERGSLTWWLTNPSQELSNFCVQYLLYLTEVIDKQLSFQQHDRSVTCLTDKYAPNPFICLWQTYIFGRAEKRQSSS